MNHGLSFLPDAEPGTKPAPDYYRDVLDMSCMADQAGLATVKMTEHHAGTYGGYCPDPLLFLTAVAQRTTRIRLLTGCLLPVFHHPITLAGRIAQADVLCGGRLDIGFARAFLPAEFDMFQIDMDESRERYEATIAAVEGLLSNERFSADNRYFSFSGVALTPPSVQAPHPPFWGAAARARESFAWLGQKGYGLLTALTVQRPEHLTSQMALYRDVFVEHHRRPGKVTMLVPLFVDRDDSKARQRGEHYLARYHAAWSRAAATWRGRVSTAYPGYTDMARMIQESSPALMAENGSVVFGDPARVRERIGRLQETFAVDQILWNVDFGAMERDDALGSVRLLIEQVLT